MVLTISNLKRYKGYLALIKVLNEKLERYQAQAENITATLTNMPKGNSLSDPVGKNAPKIADLKKEIAAAEKEVQYIESWLNNIDDPQTKSIFYYRYESGLSWGQVVDAVEGNNTKESIRSIHNRYLKKH